MPPGQPGTPPSQPGTTPSRFGPAVAAGLLAGVLVVQVFPRLPGFEASVALLVLALLAWWRPGWPRVAGALLAGVALAFLQGRATLASQWLAARSGEAVLVVGQVLGLPVVAADAVRFEFIVERGPAGLAAGSKLRLGWYARAGDDPLPRVEPGSRWQLPLRLRAPRGLLNPGGFDFERRAIEQRIVATGYVTAPEDARPLGPAAGAGARLDRLRAALSARIATAVPGPAARFVAALALGDTRGLDDHDWEVLRATGLTHLIAISGFHVGLVAGFGAVLGRLPYALFPALGRRWPRPQGSAAAALLLAAAYTALAGFALPTVRTLLMIAAVVLARLARRPQTLAQSLALATICVLLWDPASVLAPGFWLSFVGVAWLAWCLPYRPGEGWLRPFLASQAVAMLGLLPLSVWFFSQASLPGPLVNLVGIPWISLVVVPLALLGLAFEPFLPAAADLCWQLAADLMQWLWWALEWVAAWPPALAWLPEPTLFATGLALLGVFWLMLPRTIPGKPLAALLLLPLLWPALDRPARGEVDLHLLDVGQGLALLVRTRHHALLYDAGPAPPHGLDLGEAVVVPALRALGVSRLDRLVLSHGDNDHAGGAGAVRRALAPPVVMAPEGWAAAGMRACVAGQRWRWDGVDFEVLHPTPHFPYLRNDSSCVLSVRAGARHALLAGDIGRHVEARLAKLPPAQIRADLLLVPHHGSDTSSSLDFLAAVRPSVGLVAVGEGNRFGLPTPRVLDRYDRYSVALHDSAGSGAIALRLDADGVQLRERRRQDQPRYWRHAGPGGAGYAIGRQEPER
ncbi:DNA internalization-related competence protein ComEC/Rec2 [Arenimonas sp.]|uniref:DNA internalization-related competence protein ComEC/Rec2 n=1 Tax=Arenimonas sp. TaxID=1872635 RepID=UPI002E2FC332|nr:DNA internalization-related competence protein ComEC/Rec2 [Arenimonas sp.]HEX4854737.1 DNA internalization-related competence protein ComEC/Rec2 [Arenimonas sp.]